MPRLNRQIVLAARPRGFPKTEDFRLQASPLPEPADGHCLIEIGYLSVDPYMRGLMDDRASWTRPVQLGQVMVGGGVGRILASRHPDFEAGDEVVGEVGWQEYAAVPGTALRKLHTGAAPSSTALGALGMPGVTAYFGMLEVGRPQAGETVVVSAAAGAVGSIAAQIAKIQGCQVVGTAGQNHKVRYLTEELGLDRAFNYRSASDYSGRLQQLCPHGIDVYFDNVGGLLTDAVIPLLNVGARVALCGQISQYNLTKPETGPRLLRYLIIKRARIQGFLAGDFDDRRQEALLQLAEWLKMQRLRYRETVTEGIENTPRAFLAMLSGDNIGKQLVRVRDQGSESVVGSSS